VDDINSRSIGIELDNTGAQPFPEPQMAALEDLLTGVLARWAIPRERVIAHSDMAPARKFDPGARFDWRRLALRGLSVWPEDDLTRDLSGAPDGAGFGDLAAAIGYDPCQDADAVLRAFRLRFRPGACGPLDGHDLRLAGNLARRFPVDRASASA
jgi:N-acetylmuramoyl-L-alanine amidase